MRTNSQTRVSRCISVLWLGGLVAVAGAAVTTGATQRWSFSIAIALILLVGLVGYVANRAASTRLLYSQAQTSAFLEAAVDAVLVIDEQGIIQDANPAAVELFGYTAEELLGANVSLLMPEPNRSKHDAYLERYRDTGEPRIIGIGRQTTAQHKSGRLFPVHLAVGKTRVAGFRRFVGFVRDVSDQVRHQAEIEEANQRLRAEQEKLIHAEKLSSIGLLAAGIAHEVNNPLAGVMACMKALQFERYPEGRRDAYFETARSGLDRIGKIVRGLLDYARRGTMVPGQWKPTEVVEGCLSLLAPFVNKKNLQVKNGVAGGHAAALPGDRSQMMQALMNILMNAAQASRHGGVIEIRLEHRHDQVGLVVEDAGPGIPVEDLRKVCDPFFTTKPGGQGTGLGLSVTIGIVEAHRGELEIGNTDGGARIVLWLPTAAEGASNA